jgi:putative flippase GtrA
LRKGYEKYCKVYSDEIYQLIVKATETTIHHAKLAAVIQFIKFGIVGFSNTVISYVVYFILVYFKVHYFAANIFSFFAGIINSFFWNNRYVFKKHDNNRNAPVSFIRMVIAYCFTGLLLQNLFLYIFIDVLSYSKYLAPFFGMVITVPLNFVMNKFWVFRSPEKKG